MTKKEAIKIVEGSIWEHPEVKAIRRKQQKMEEEWSAKSLHFCKGCGTWSPYEPTEYAALGREWKRIFNREVERVWKTKPAA